MLEFCVVAGSEAVLQYAQKCLYVIKTLKEFVHVDEMGRDKGILIREKSRDLVELLTNESLLAEARSTGVVPNIVRSKSAEPLLVESNQRRRVGNGEQSFDDLQNIDENEALRIALDESRRELGLSSRYKSLELDNTDADDEDDAESPIQPKALHNPFMIEVPMTVPLDPFEQMPALPSSLPLLCGPNPFAVPQIEYSVPPVISAFDGQTMPKRMIGDESVFIPMPTNYSSVSSENQFSAKPVGPHLGAPQFSSLARKESSHGESSNFLHLESNPFEAAEEQLQTNIVYTDHMQK